jgi:hypothetical protein
MPATPDITLTATLDDLTGVAVGSTANPAKLRITLCGFGPILPKIAGTAMIARTGPFDIYSTGAQISTLLWGNDQITPAGTFYSIEILDGSDNVVQCGSYQFTGGGTIDLSNANQIVPPYGFTIGLLAVKSCTGAVPGTIYTAPGTVLAVFYNGALLDPPGSPTPDYSVAGGTVITLNFTTQAGDQINALCIL